VSEPFGPPAQRRAADAMKWNLVVKLERGEIGGAFDAIVHTEKDDPIKVALADDLEVTGKIAIDSGSIELRQKKFEVDRGTLRMRAEDASNPDVNLTAHWDGPDGGRVFVDYVGLLRPITDDKIRFRSDPPRSKEDIIATLLFGTDLSSTPVGGAPAEAGTAGVGQLAADVTSTLASQALKALVSSKYVSFSVDTTSEGAFRGKVEWRASEGLTLGLSGEQVQAEAATSTNDAREAGAQGEVSLEWKFLPNWSLRSSFGAGVREPTTGIDVLWQYNYNY
jgi:translocation and assembly module TamB